MSEIQQIRVEIDLIRRSIDELEPKLEKLPRQLNTFRELERVALRYLALSRRLGLPEDINRAINFIARMVTVARMAQISISLLMATNPLTIALGVAGMVGVAVSFNDSIVGY